MEPNLRAAYQNELDGLQARRTRMARTGESTVLLDDRIASLRALLGPETVPAAPDVVEVAVEQPARRGRRKASGGVETPEG